MFKLFTKVMRSDHKFKFKFKFKFYFIATISNRNSNNIQEANHMEWKQWEDLKRSKSR